MLTGLEQGTEKQLKKQSMLYWVAEQVLAFV